MKEFALAVVLVLSIVDLVSAQAIDRSRQRPDDPVPASVSTPARVERQEQTAAPAPPATAPPTAPPSPYNVEDPRAIVDWLFNRSAVRGR
jgi:hypothetical protein